MFCPAAIAFHIAAGLPRSREEFDNARMELSRHGVMDGEMTVAAMKKRT